MKCYRVKPHCDQCLDANGNMYIARELFTPSEVKKHRLNKSFLEEVYVSKSQVYVLFGARFSEATGSWNEQGTNKSYL